MAEKEIVPDQGGRKEAGLGGREEVVLGQVAEKRWQRGKVPGSGTRPAEKVSACLPAYLAVWLSGCLAVWLSGCLAVWLFAPDVHLPDVRLSRRASHRRA